MISRRTSSNPNEDVVFPDCSTVIRGAPRLVIGAPSYSEGWQECPPRAWYSPEIDASKFTLHILSDTPGGFQWLKYILLMLCNATHRLGVRKGIILCQRVRGFVQAVRAVQNTWVFLMETGVLPDVCKYWCLSTNIWHCSYYWQGISIVNWFTVYVAEIHATL